MGEADPAASFLYTGHRYDSDTGLYQMRARYYDAGMGRFLTRDTYPVNAGNPAELNRYGYVAGNPVNAVDPSGQLMVEIAPQTRESVEQSKGLIYLHQAWLAASRRAAYRVLFLITPVVVAPVLALVGDILRGIVGELLSPKLEQVGTPNTQTQTQPAQTSQELESTAREQISSAVRDGGDKSIHIALGYNIAPITFVPILLMFAANLSNESRIVVPWNYWDSVNLTDMSEFDMSEIEARAFARILRPVLRTARHIHVNLEGLRGWDNYKISQLDDFIDDNDPWLVDDEEPNWDRVSSLFAMELSIIRREDLCSKTTFYDSGSTNSPPIPLPIQPDICN